MNSQLISKVKIDNDYWKEIDLKIKEYEMFVRAQNFYGRSDK